MAEFYVHTELGRLAVRAIGDGPPVVLWHSMFVDSHSWDRLIPELAGRSLFLIDGPSAGRSDRMRTPADISACARAAVTVVEEICRRTGVDRVDWVGNAWGGHVGLELAARRTDLLSTLVAISAPTFPIDDAIRRQINTLLPIYRLIGPRGPVRSAVVTALFTDATRAHDPSAVAIAESSLRLSGRAMVPAIVTAILRRTDLEWAARQLTCPVLFVTTDDRGEWTAEQARPVAECMADARVVEISGARLIPALEQPTATGAAIRRFWAEVGVGTWVRLPHGSSQP
ncbi:alpha/beta hydrolase [Gordonia sp. CPCC 205515]|uniref:alpha/beta fold hydrolase n=1 Tax=Gordonia sp. CPCC 205515 TaxID=3140791 RepID=UPI003AF3D8B1